MTSFHLHISFVFFCVWRYAWFCEIAKMYAMTFFTCCAPRYFHEDVVKVILLLNTIGSPCLQADITDPCWYQPFSLIGSEEYSIRLGDAFDQVGLVWSSSTSYAIAFIPYTFGCVIMFASKVRVNDVELRIYSTGRMCPRWKRQEIRGNNLIERVYKSWPLYSK